MTDDKVLDFSLSELQSAVSSAAAFRCRTKLRPIGDDGDKVFPPTYAGGVYAVEDRRIDGRVARCVLLDSVQGQANRMEEVLQEAFLPNWRELPLDGSDPDCGLPVFAVHVDKHGRITSLTAPHRIHDAILRDSEIQEEKNGEKTLIRFRDSGIGTAIVQGRVHNATAFYRYCPTALLFGTWDSTGGEGLDSAKIPRAVVSEIIGVDITAGVRTASRIDPLGIERTAAIIYRRKDGDWAAKLRKANGEEQWTGAVTEQEIEVGPGGLRKFGREGKPSDINHGNIIPHLPRFDPREEVQKQHLDRLPDVLRDQPVRLTYSLESRDGRLKTDLAVDRSSIRGHAVKPGGVTMAYALHTWTLSLTQLRRLRFPVNGSHEEDRNHAARTVLAALALYALALQHERGYWLRSRCELVPETAATAVFERIGTDGTTTTFCLPSAQSAKTLLEKALAEAEKGKEGTTDKAAPTSSQLPGAESAKDPFGDGAQGTGQEAKNGIGWEGRVIRLTPMRKLLELVKASDARRPEEMPEEEAEESEAANAGDQG